MYHSFFITLSVDGHLDCLHVLVIVNNTAVNTEVHMSFSIMVSSGYMPSSGIIGSYGSFIPSFLRNLHTILHSGCYQFTFPPTVQEGSFFSTPFPALFVDFLMMAKLHVLIVFWIRIQIKNTHCNWLMCLLNLVYAGGPVLILGWGTIFHMPHLRPRAEKKIFLKRVRENAI